MDPKEVLRSNPPNIPDTHWESLVHHELLGDQVINGIITLTNESAGLAMTIDTMSGDVTITETTSATIESVNTVLRFHADAVTGWTVKK